MPTPAPLSAYDQLVAAIDQACREKKDTPVVDVAVALDMKEVASKWKTAYWQYELETEAEGTITVIHGWNDVSGSNPGSNPGGNPAPNPGSSEAELFEISRTRPPATYRNQYE
ncbi:hypothetical protein [Achromobacter aloeverae]|uniref:Uncharacterized protein n=1 Tax=Achromobacter aloeverae TaxID=1750518 RepID=A0A4V1MRP3_9BURK|nr:hypothetical protein [Achromobacter aloeverae]RXN85341.1 hypothetical protein C7R54_22905 [Achromobacter aloeverae]